jgi:hypothetical protein
MRKSKQKQKERTQDSKMITGSREGDRWIALWLRVELIGCHSIIDLSTTRRRTFSPSDTRGPERAHHPYSMTPFTSSRRWRITPFQQNLPNTYSPSQFPSKNSPQSPITNPFMITIRQRTKGQSVNRNENNFLVHKRVTTSVACFNPSYPQILWPPTMFSHTQYYPNFT